MNKLKHDIGPPGPSPSPPAGLIILGALIYLIVEYWWMIIVIVLVLSIISGIYNAKK